MGRPDAIASRRMFGMFSQLEANTKVSAFSYLAGSASKDTGPV
jgi:hypothetical protein